MTCTCGHDKNKHDIIERTHRGSCRFRTYFDDRPNEGCICRGYVKAPPIPCSSCGKPSSNLIDRVVVSDRSDSFYQIWLCRKCNHKESWYTKDGGVKPISKDRVGWVCKCGKYCNDEDAVKKHLDESGHFEERGMLWLKPEVTI